MNVSHSWSYFQVRQDHISRQTDSQREKFLCFCICKHWLTIEHNKSQVLCWLYYWKNPCIDTVFRNLCFYFCHFWALKNWCFWTVVPEKTLESPLDSKIKPINPKGNQTWIFIRKTDAEAEAPILWSPDVKNWLIRKDPDAGKGWRQEDRRTTEDEMVGWHHWLDTHEFEQDPGVGDGQGSLACCSPWGGKDSDMTERLNWKMSH